MGSNRAQHGSLASGLAHQRNIALFEIADSAVDELRRAAAGPARKIALLKQHNGEASQRGLTGDTRTTDSSAYDHNVDQVLRRAFEIALALVCRKVSHRAARLLAKQRTVNAMPPPREAETAHTRSRDRKKSLTGADLV
jgi:hypothetical protein